MPPLRKATCSAMTSRGSGGGLRSNSLHRPARPAAEAHQRVDQVQSGAGQAAARQFVRIVAPAARDDARRVLVAEVRLDVQHLADLSFGDDAAQRGHRRKAALVVAEREHDAGLAAGRDRALGLGERQRERLLAPHRLAGRRDRDDLLDMQRVRGRQHHRLDARIGDRVGELGGELESVRGREVAHLVRLLAHAADEAQALALPLRGLDDSLAPASEADDGCVDHGWSGCAKEGAAIMP